MRYQNASDPAFPFVPGGGEDMRGDEGMSMREYFAGQALAHLAGTYPPGEDGKTAEQRTAEACFRYADAMIAQSKKGTS